MPLSDAAARKIADVLRKHVGTETLEQIVHELLEIRGDKEFRDTIERLVHALGMADPVITSGPDHLTYPLMPVRLASRSRQKA